MGDVIAAIDSKQPGDEVELTVWRDGEERDVSVELTDRPASADRG
jgi:S1-C subfamily serine protease